MSEVVKKTKSYDYTNGLGFLKRIVIDLEPVDGKYSFRLYERYRGECTGYGKMTREEINDFLQHYKVKETF